MKNIAVYCSSSKDVSSDYTGAAKELGRLIGKKGLDLIYGGSQLGLMGIVARNVKENGGRVTGVIPDMFSVYAEGEDEVIVVPDIYERIKIMESKADAFIALPGGFGTIQEIAGALVGKQLHNFNKSAGMDRKALVLLNVGGFFNPFIEMLDKIFSEGLAPEKNKMAFYVASNPAEALEYIESYVPVDVGAKTLAKAEPD